MGKLEITSIRVKKIVNTNGSKIVGTASIVLNHEFIVKDIRIIQTENKLFCAMPSRRLEDNSFMDICHPLDSTTRKYLENLIISEFINQK